jgi:hypothetical protein
MRVDFVLVPGINEASWIQIFKINMNQVTIFDPISLDLGFRGELRN